MNIQEGKKEYLDMQIPEELHQRMKQVIEQDKKRRQERKVIHMIKRTMASAAACIVIFAAGLNTSAAFAETAAGLPVIGGLARVLTIRSYHASEGNINLDMEVPAIENASGDAGGAAFTEAVNQEIEKIVEDYTAQAEQEFAAYQEAFFATGGTEEEWNDRQMDIIVDYEVKYQKDPVLSLELTAAKGWVAASEERHYYNLDVASGRELTLSDVLGDDWKNIANEEIDRQIKERIAADPSASFFGYGDNELTEAKFTSVSEDTEFYLNAEGDVVIVFPKYEIAPGYMGILEFTIQD